MSKQTLLKVTGFIFTIVGAGHLLRLIYGAPVLFSRYEVPMWISVPAFIVAWALAYYSFKNNRG